MQRLGTTSPRLSRIYPARFCFHSCSRGFHWWWLCSAFTRAFAYLKHLRA